MSDQKYIDKVFEIATKTPYTVNGINDFIGLSGIKVKEAIPLLERFDKAGISRLKDVNTLIKLGHFRH